MSLTAKQLGGIEVSKSEDSTSYQIKYFVPEDELSSYIPEIGEKASWAPVAATVSAYSKSWYGPKCWTLTITAKPYDSELLTLPDGLGSFVSKEYSVQDIHFPVDWWGAWLATPSDCPQFDSDGKLSTGERRHLNASGAWSKPGDPIFFSSVPYEISASGIVKVAKDGASKGEADYSRSPFLASDMDLDLSLIGQSVKTRVYNCSFHTKRKPNNITDFVGVSGEFTGSCRPADSGAGRWKALSQHVENARDKDGVEWTRVSRSMLQAPLGLKWDPAKNGGTWSW